MLLLKIVPKSCLYANAFICSMLYGGLWLYCMSCCGDSRHRVWKSSTLLLINEAFCQSGIFVYAAVSKERPPSAHLFGA